MKEPEIATVVLECAAQVSGFGANALKKQLDADLMADLGLDSLKIMEIWALIENRLGLDLGVFDARQPATLRSVIEQVQAVAENKG
jgi:acyl carrier protein